LSIQLSLFALSNKIERRRTWRKPSAVRRYLIRLGIQRLYFGILFRHTFYKQQKRFAHCKFLSANYRWIYQQVSWRIGLLGFRRRKSGKQSIAFQSGIGKSVRGNGSGSINLGKSYHYAVGYERTGPHSTN